MREINLSKDVFPIGKFKKQASRLLREVNEDKRTIVVTQNGTPVGVVIPPDEYDRLREGERFIEAATRGLEQSEADLGISDKELKKELEAEFGSAI